MNDNVPGIYPGIYPTVRLGRKRLFKKLNKHDEIKRKIQTNYWWIIRSRNICTLPTWNWRPVAFKQIISVFMAMARWGRSRYIKVYILYFINNLHLYTAPGCPKTSFISTCTYLTFGRHITTDKQRVVWLPV